MPEQTSFAELANAAKAVVAAMSRYAEAWIAVDNAGARETADKFIRENFDATAQIASDVMWLRTKDNTLGVKE